MQVQRNANAFDASIAPGTVSGLGVCDAWRLELSAAQWPWLLDELDTLRPPLEEALERARDDHADVERREYELRMITMVRAQLPPDKATSSATVIGPVSLLRNVVPGVLRNVVDALSDVVDLQHLNDPAGRVRLVETAEAAHAWAQTVASCRALEAFSFDPLADPID